MLKRLRQVWGQRKHFISLLVGVPSYETYVEHMKKHHPEEEVVCQKQFLQKRKKQGLMQRAEKSRAVVSEKDEFSSFFFAVHVEQQKIKSFGNYRYFVYNKIRKRIDRKVGRLFYVKGLICKHNNYSFLYFCWRSAFKR